MSLILGACTDVGAARAPVVYGTDDRVEVYEQPEGVHRQIALSTIAMQLGADALDTSDPGDVRVIYEQTLVEAHELCEDVRYAQQIEPGTCSGTLIGERLLLTAGHCVSGPEDCDGASWPWLFGFSYEAPGVLRRRTRDDVYYCTRALVLRDDDAADYAIIELDRPVVGRAPVAIGGPVAVGADLTMIGHPSGLPMKIAGNATLRGARGIELYADLDAFFGNSGSGVFDPAGAVVGILVAGADDYQQRPGSSCFEILVIDPVPEGEGETLTAIGPVMEAFCARPGVVSSACGGGRADAGVLGGDAGTGADSGVGALDAGARDSAGGGCHAAPGPLGGSHRALALLALALLVTARRARR